MAGKRVIPVCHYGMSPGSLPEPLRSLQAYELSNPDHLRDLVTLLAKEAGLRTPSFDPKKLVDSLPSVESQDDIAEEMNLLEMMTQILQIQLPQEIILY